MKNSFLQRSALASAFACSFVFTTSAFAADEAICDAGVKAEVNKLLNSNPGKNADEMAQYEAEVYDAYLYCTEDAEKFSWIPSFYAAAKQCGAKVSYLGSTFYEEMSCCGYDPQRRTFACPVKVKQQFGFGGSPLPGSREHVLNCVADSFGVFRPVGHDSVHLSDSVYAPTWNFAVVANAVDNLWLVQPMSGAPRIARSILSWNFTPTDCNYRPIWGDVIDYRIRLDQ
jgi:hypothetical protein